MRYVLLLALLLPLLGAPARAQYMHAGCSDMLQAHTRQENEAHNELEADQGMQAYLDYQSAAIYRANCVDATTGQASQWNQFYEAMDYFEMGISQFVIAKPYESLGDVGADEVRRYRAKAFEYAAKAHALANDLLNRNPDGDLRGLAQTLSAGTTPQALGETP